MRVSKSLKREAEVAFSKHSQPAWFKVLKYCLLGFVLYFFWGSKMLWIVLFIMLLVALLLHFWYRYKTLGWTKSYGLWKHDEDKPGSRTE